MRFEPYLCVGGLEIVNGVRTSNYLRNGLSSTAIAVQGGAGVDMAGYCHAYDEGPYEDPVTDEAPWYVAARPESGEFLGAVVWPEALGVNSRSFTSQGPFGGTLSTPSLKGRVVNFTGLAFAGSQRGMEYGERWFSDALIQLCGDLPDALLAPVCPPIGDEARYFRTLRRVALTDGPLFAPQGTADPCVVQALSFQLSAEVPELLAPGDTLELADLASGASTSAEVDTADWLGDTAVVVRVVAVTDLNAVTISASPLAAGQTCPTAGTNAAVAYTIESLPRDHSITIDPTVREVIEWDAAGKRYVSGLQRLSFDPVFEWIEVPPCSKVCVTVHNAGSGAAQVSITRFDREL